MIHELLEISGNCWMLDFNSMAFISPCEPPDKQCLNLESLPWWLIKSKNHVKLYYEEKIVKLVPYIISPNISSTIKIDRTFMKQQQRFFYIIAWSPFLLWDLLVGAPRTSFCSSSKKLTIWEWYFFGTDITVPKQT